MPPGGASRIQLAFPGQKEATSQHLFTNAYGSSMSFQRNVGSEKAGRETPPKTRYPGENASDDEEEGEENVKQEESSCEEILKNRLKEIAKENEKIGALLDDMRRSEKSATEPETYIYSDPEFSDFYNNKKEECLTVGQIWAVYDVLDGMPSFYALTKKVLSPGFKLQITWLEPIPDNKN
ncbi:unnamed protein product [Fraxinus pennsylvanica]|uniref:DUF3444 domain-containing protein n=1 Tax=Fraxinus pennsylvanica TaxID=56036 RepID=A0AAD2E850_9LAMI|nr:unnamed protein product [Fraxinus pennsylvanica]